MEATAAKASGGGPGSFPWPECIAKMQRSGYSMDVAKKICGSIKARSGG